MVFCMGDFNLGLFMQEFWQALTTHPMTPWFGWLALGTLAIFWGLGQVRPHLPKDPIEKLQETLGMEGVSGWILTIAVFFWSTLFLVLFGTLMIFIADIIWTIPNANDPAEEAAFRFLLTKTTALTAVLAAVVAVPFTIVRIKLTAEQNRHAQDVLYNGKLNEAVESLHSRYQVTEGDVDVWKDDIIKRNGAIDRLESLAVERPEHAPRIARMLCIYLKEMSHEHPAHYPREDLTTEELRDWAAELYVARSDMESAAQVLGRMHKKTGLPPEKLKINLDRANLQAMSFMDLNFENARFNHASLDGATFLRTAMKGAWFENASAIHADFNSANIENSILSLTIISGASFEKVSAKSAALRNILSRAEFGDRLAISSFGDGSVGFPEGTPFPDEKWPNMELDISEFVEEWKHFKNDPDAYIPPQHRNS